MNTIIEAVEWFESIKYSSKPVSALPAHAVSQAFYLFFNEYPDPNKTDSEIFESMENFVDGYRQAQDSFE